MVKMLEIRELVRLVDQSSLETLEVKNGGLRVFLKKVDDVPVYPFSDSSTQSLNLVDKQTNDHSDVCVSEPDDNPKSQVLHSMNVGTFQSIVKPGDKVEIDSLLGHCSVKGLLLKFEITSDYYGIISEVLAEEGQLIDYGQPLYKITVGKELGHV
ncbi:acetyl-CoA carboxylase biotin carboxyl carrier protein [Neobacillus sp. NRS-1170]|uniref:acetyl-CoA carboxylase biotin carboxyl carrier protein n=1 Tax=Neobacillus sp. NRS-1170 TaxID=3233898 RepID=UPI003D2847CE